MAFDPRSQKRIIPRTPPFQDDHETPCSRAGRIFRRDLANAQIYQWKDESGKTVISDKPPGPAPARGARLIQRLQLPRRIKRRWPDRELDIREKRQKEAQEAAEKAEKEQASASKERAKNCESARNSLQTLESGEPVVMRDSKGEAYYLEDAQRAQQIARARQAMQNNCR
jgi:preprotein translocase subunit SecD